MDELAKQIAAAQLAGEEFRFKCVCGKQHKAGSRKTLKKCLRKITFYGFREYELAPCIENIHYYEDDNTASITFADININIVPPGIPISTLYNKTEELISFLISFHKPMTYMDDEYLKLENHQIKYSFKHSLTEAKPYLLLMKNYSNYLNEEYRKKLEERYGLLKDVVLEMAYAVKNHPGIFIEEEADIKTIKGDINDMLDLIAKKAVLAMPSIQRDDTCYSIKNFITQLIGEYYFDYRSEMAMPRAYTTADYRIYDMLISDGIISSHDYGKIHVHSNFHLKEKHFRIYVSISSKIASVARKIFKLLYPIEKAANYMLQQELKKYMRNKKNKPKAESKAESRQVKLVSLF
jgi:hypothetical protein